MTDTNAPPSHELRHTPLHSLHLDLGGRMVPFAGWSMPVQYRSGVTAEHHQCRNSAALFDVSHMGQLRFRPRFGSTLDEVALALETLVPADIVGLAPFQQRYGLLLNEAGGILDDLMITRRLDDLFVVVNASNTAEDLMHLRRHLDDIVEIDFLDGQGLLALQGPLAFGVLRQLDTRANDLYFMTGAFLNLGGADCFVTRSGYTGEDGFEISVAAADAPGLARTLLGFPDVQPAGLGARDTLRLEAGLCLHGHDITAMTTPVEAALTWAIPQVRRAGGERAGGYPGAAVIGDQLARGVSRKRVGLVSSERAPVREGAPLLGEGGEVIGAVTSGTTTPTVGHPVAMGYVTASQSAVGSTVLAEVREKRIALQIAPLPFVPHRYVRRPSATSTSTNNSSEHGT